VNLLKPRRAAGMLGMTSGLRRRLLVMLIAPLMLLALASAWLDYRSAENVAVQQDQRLLALIPLVADSVIGAGDPLLLLLAPPVEEFLNERPGAAEIAILDIDGKVLHGADWLGALPPPGTEPEFHSEERAGVTWRIVRQRQPTVIGDIVAAVADGSDPRQRWAQAILLKVLLPNLLLIAAAAIAVRFAVEQALRPLLVLKDAVERRSPRDLSALDETASPEEVRPLVQSLNRLFALVNAQAESQRRFIADAAHQLRTPLAGLQAQVEAWAQAASRPAAGQLPASGAAPTSVEIPRDQVQKLRNATRRTSQLANQLLALSRADARGMHSQPMNRVDLKALCEAVLEAHLDNAAARHIDLGLEAAPAQVMGHEWLLRELLSNLTDNAVKYAHEGGAVTIRCGRRGEVPFVQVEDDGPGVPAADLPRILDRFYRVQGTLGEGNGLGLAIAEEIARVHHSHLQLATGSQGRGLRVTLELPG
jgi:two-component system sensor histidine kinase TctE